MKKCTECDKNSVASKKKGGERRYCVNCLKEKLKRRCKRNWKRRCKRRAINFWDGTARILWGDSATAAAFVTLLLAVTGGYGSIYSTEIKRGITSQITKDPQQAPDITHLGLFLVLLLITGVVFYLHQRARDSRSIAEHRTLAETGASLSSNVTSLVGITEQLGEKSETLEMLVRSQPPQHFLATFTDMFDKFIKHHQAIDNLSDEEQQKQVIRSLLVALTILVGEYNPNKEQLVFGCNIMVYHESGGISEPAEKNKMREMLKFAPKEIGLDRVKGFLVFESDLSVRGTLLELKDEADGSIERFALPIPKDNDQQTSPPKRWRYLPGAPAAFCTRTFDMFTDTTTISNWAKEYASLEPGVIDDIVTHFKNSSILSFLSIPLQVDRSTEPIGILNIDCNSKLILSEENAQCFVPTVRPLIVLLTELLSKVNLKF